MKQILTALLLASLATTHAIEPKLNVLLILSDDHSYPHVGCYGNKDIMTPNLDKFASEGMRFDRAYVTCPQCVPSRASIFTGRSPVAIAMSRFSAPLPRGFHQERQDNQERRKRQEQYGTRADRGTTSSRAVARATPPPTSSYAKTRSRLARAYRAQLQAAFQ